jgi:hypothetical protein
VAYTHQLKGWGSLHSETQEAETEGFEPPEVWPSTVFKTAALNHSAISPYSFRLLYPSDYSRFHSHHAKVQTERLSRQFHQGNFTIAWWAKATNLWLGRRDLNPRVTGLRFLHVISVRRYVPMSPPRWRGLVYSNNRPILIDNRFAGEEGLEPTLFQYFQSRVNSPPLGHISYTPKSRWRWDSNPCASFDRQFCRLLLSTTQPLHQNTNTSKNHKKTRLSWKMSGSVCVRVSIPKYLYLLNPCLQYFCH